LPSLDNSNKSTLVDEKEKTVTSNKLCGNTNLVDTSVDELNKLLLNPSQTQIYSDDVESERISLPSTSSDDFLLYSDSRINLVKSEENILPINTSADEITDLINLVSNPQKPQGAAYVAAKLNVGQRIIPVDTYICIDTGADFTVCDNTFLRNNFGENYAKYIIPMINPPRLKSASGQSLKILGKVNFTLQLGEYKMLIDTIVYDHKSDIFLLGNDAFYDRLIYDKGRYLAFADERYAPIPIQYNLNDQKVKAIQRYRISPYTSAIVQVKVTSNSQLTGREIVLSPLDEEDYDVNHNFTRLRAPVRNTVSVIDSTGHAVLLVQNDTEEELIILPEIEIAAATFIDGEVNSIHSVSLDAEGKVSKEKDKWPISALTGSLADKMPENIIIRWDRLDKLSDGHVKFLHDKEERRNLLDGTGEGFPVPPAAESLHPDEVINLNPDPEEWLNAVKLEHLTVPQQSKLKTLLSNKRDAFSKSKTEIGCCNYFKVDLPLKPGTGYLYNKPRPLPFKQREIAAQTIAELLAKGVIRPSRSPHTTNVVCVKKKTVNGVISYRVCCDLRQVNEHSIPNRFPNYWIEDAMAKIQGASWRSAMDFKDAFHMLMLNEDSIPVTAFHFNNLMFEYVRVPFGHVGAMNAFCCLMAILCADYEPASYFADDLMITTKTIPNVTVEESFDQHLIDLGGMLDRIIHAGLKLVAHKCIWAYGADKPMD